MCKWCVVGNITIRVRCIDSFGGYSEAFQTVEVKPPTKVDVSALGETLTNLADQQNTGQLVALASTFVSTLTAAGAQLTTEQKKLQMAMTDSVRFPLHFFIKQPEAKTSLSLSYHSNLTLWIP